MMTLPKTVAEVRAALEGFSPDLSASEDVERQASVAMILLETPDGLETLFIQRAERHGDPWSGHMAFPGGRREPHDADLAAAAERETFEEVGLRLGPELFLARLSDERSGRLRAFGMSLSAFLYWVPERPALALNHEVAGAVWVPLSFLGDPANVGHTTFDILGAPRIFPAFHFGPYVIWGLTYRIVAEFMSLFGVPLPLESPINLVE